jgi:hypothetical protein
LAEQPNFSNIKNAKLIVEQSFSDFGDLDLLILLDHNRPSGDSNSPTKQAILIEAKVSTDTNYWQTLEDRLGEFMRLIADGEGGTSNLFVQLHRKVRLVESLNSEGRHRRGPTLGLPGRRAPGRARSLDTGTFVLAGPGCRRYGPRPSAGSLGRGDPYGPRPAGRARLRV